MHVFYVVLMCAFYQPVCYEVHTPVKEHPTVEASALWGLCQVQRDLERTAPRPEGVHDFCRNALPAQPTMRGTWDFCQTMIRVHVPPSSVDYEELGFECRWENRKGAYSIERPRPFR
jgi:hypothetical protein